MGSFLEIGDTARGLKSRSSSGAKFSSCMTNSGTIGKCKPLALCQGETLGDAKDNKCVISDGKLGNSTKV